MRITGGRASGVRLEVPSGGAAIRPATDRMREAVFSSLGAAVEGARVLDLFAGTGAYGLEALSRGAAAVLWVEADRRAARALERNRAAVLRSLGASAAGLPTRLLARDLRRPAIPAGERFDLLFADPPYRDATDWLPRILALAEEHLSPGPSARLLLEAPGSVGLASSGWEETRRFGKTASGPCLRILRRGCNQK